MRMRKLLRNLLKLAVGGAVVLGIAGCNGPSAMHAKAVAAANERWQNVHSSVIIQAAQQYFDTGDLDQAERTLLEVVAADPDNARLHLLAGRIALERGQLERSHGRLQRAIELDPRLAEACYYQGIVLQRWQRFDAALDRYRKAYGLRADSVAYLLAVSEVLVALDRSDEAIELLSDKLVYFDQNAAIRAALGQLSVMRKDYGRAASMFRQAMLLEPDNQTIAEELAMAQLASGQSTDAINTLEPLCLTLPVDQRPDLWCALANAYRQANRLDKARDVARELRDAAPRDVESWIRLGELAWLDQDLSAASIAARRAITIAPRRYEGYMLVGMVLQSSKATAEALAMFDRAAELAPQSAEPVILRGLALQQAGKPGAAAKAYEQALRRQPGDDRARSLLSAVQRGGGT